MADLEFFESQLASQLPQGWFDTNGPVVSALLAGLASSSLSVNDQIEFVQAQTRLATASGGFLELWAAEFDGDFPRRANETDDSYRGRIQAEILREKATRNGMRLALLAETGYEPLIYEPMCPSDNGAWDNGIWGYDVAGSYSDPTLGLQFFVQAYRPPEIGAPGLQGYAGNDITVAVGGYDSGNIAYTDDSLSLAPTIDQGILDTINRTKPIGSIAWVNISPYVAPIVLDETPLDLEMWFCGLPSMPASYVGPGVAAGSIPDLPDGYEFLLDDAGDYIVNIDGDYIVVPA